MTLYGNKPLRLLIEQKGIILLNRLIQNIFVKKRKYGKFIFCNGKGIFGF